MLTPALEYFKEHNYRRYELTALTIASRAYQQLDDIPRAHAMATDVLKVAETMQNDVQVALALGNLALQATTLGSLPKRSHCASAPKPSVAVRTTSSRWRSI